MTRKGDTAKPSAKKLARHSNPFSTAVKTPDGIFRSINECAEYYKRTAQSIVHRCKMGERQRRANKERTLHDNDWRGWEFWGVSRKIKKIAVRTPLGEFDSMKEAGIAHGVQTCTIRSRCLREAEGYSFIDDKEDKE